MPSVSRGVVVVEPAPIIGPDAGLLADCTLRMADDEASRRASPSEVITSTVTPSPGTSRGLAPAAARRRALLGMGVAIVALGAAGASAAAQPDGELLAACAAFDAWTAEYGALCHRESTMSVDDYDDAHAALIEVREPLVDRICRRRATTPAGLRARARSILAMCDELDPEADAADEGDYWEDRMVAALLRDLATGAAA